jgi:hypothetical protein
MAFKQQTSMEQSNVERNAIRMGDVTEEQLTSSISSTMSVQRKPSGVNLTFVSLITALIGVCLTMMIALSKPGEPVTPKLVVTSPDGSVTSAIEVPTVPAVDKRFMNGLEVEPAPPAATDPFARRGVHK